MIGDVPPIVLGPKSLPSRMENERGHGPIFLSYPKDVAALIKRPAKAAE
jgi:hypothetical protein